MGDGTRSPTNPLGSRREVAQAVTRISAPGSAGPVSAPAPAPHPAAAAAPYPAAGQWQPPPGPVVSQPVSTGQFPGQYPATAQPAAPMWSGDEPGRRDGTRITPVGWLLRGLGLLAVSVISGTLWIALKPGTHAPTPPATPPGAFQFSDTGFQDSTPNCASESTAEIKQFFARYPCTGMDRALYTTRAPDGTQVLTSLVTVRMPDPNSAVQLERTVRENRTGNVEDLVTAGVAKRPGWPNLRSDHGYASKVVGSTVVLGKSEYFGTQRGDDPELVKITADALRLAH